MQKANVAVLNQLGYTLPKQDYQIFPYYEAQSKTVFVSIAQNMLLINKSVKGFIYASLENGGKSTKNAETLISMLKYYKTVKIC